MEEGKRGGEGFELEFGKYKEKWLEEDVVKRKKLNRAKWIL